MEYEDELLLCKHEDWCKLYKDITLIPGRLHCPSCGNPVVLYIKHNSNLLGDIND